MDKNIASTVTGIKKNIYAFNGILAQSKFVYSPNYEKNWGMLQDGLDYIVRCDEAKRFEKSDETLQKHLDQIKNAVNEIGFAVMGEGGRYATSYSLKMGKVRDAEKDELTAKLHDIVEPVLAIRGYVEKKLNPPLQFRMMQGAIARIRKGAMDLEGSLILSSFHYDIPVYQAFCRSLIAAVDYIEKLDTYSPEDPQLKKYREFLKAGVSPMLFQIQEESSKNLHTGDGADEHNTNWDFEMHQIKNKMAVLNGSMTNINENIELLMKGAGKNTGGRIAG